MTGDRVADRYFEKIEGDEALSKALFGQKHFLTVVLAVDRVTQRRDYVTRKDVEELATWGIAVVASLAKLMQTGVLSMDPREDLSAYRYRVIPGPLWDSLRTMAGCE